MHTMTGGKGHRVEVEQNIICKIYEDQIRWIDICSHAYFAWAASSDLQSKCADAFLNVSGEGERESEHMRKICGHTIDLFIRQNCKSASNL